jgi:hypothetical protein
MGVSPSRSPTIARSTQALGAALRARQPFSAAPLEGQAYAGLEELLESAAAPVWEEPRARAATHRMAEDPSRPDREAAIAGGPAIQIPRLGSQGDCRRLAPGSDRSAREWRLRRCTPSNARARLRKEPLQGPLGRWSDNPDS